MRIPRTIPAGVKVVDGYPIPAGGAGDGTESGGQEADGTDEGGDGQGTESTDQGDADTETDGDDQGGNDDTDGDRGRAGGPDALKADLARERKRRKAVEAELAAARQATESETEAREREIRTQAQAPAIKALRLAAIEAAARDAGFVYPEDVYALLSDEERESVEVDLEEETPTVDRAAATTVVKALAKRRKGLVRRDGDEDDRGNAGGFDHQRGGSNGRGSSSDPNATFRGLFRTKLGAPTGR